MATPTNLPGLVAVGDLATASYQNDLRGAFRILQVVEGTASAIVSNSTQTMVDTGLSATITPQSNTSKVLVIVSQTFGKIAGNVNNAVGARVMRGGTNIRTFAVATLYTNSSSDNIGSISCQVLDSPATLLATTYKTQFANFTAAANVSVNPNNAVATIILMEVSA